MMQSDGLPEALETVPTCALNWLSLLVAELPMRPAMIAELSRQLCAQAQRMAGITLDDGYHAFVPPAGGFAVRYATVDGAAVASVAGDLVGRDAHAHPAVLAWRWIAGADPGRPCNSTTSDLEFFWLEFPAEELGRPRLIDGDDMLAPGRFGFDIGWHVYSLPDVMLRLVARATFSPEQIGGLIDAIDAAIARWNRSEPTKIHYRAVPRVAADRSMFSIYVDLGSGGLEALAEILGSIDAEPASAAMTSCDVGAVQGVSDRSAAASERI